MKTNRTILTMVALLVAFSLNAQVAINTDGSSPHASTMLDIQSSSSGTSFSNLNIANMSTAAPVTAPKTGLIAYNTNTTTGPGLVMWTGSRWVMFELEGINWKLLGNAGTSSATNFLGTTDNVSLPIRTNNTERMRFWSDGTITVHTTSAFGTSSFFAMPSSSTYTAIDGYTTGSGNAIRAYNAGSGSGIWGRTANASAFGVWATNANTSGTGLIASGNNYSATYLTSGTGIAGSGGDGIFGKGKDSDGTGIIGTGCNGDSTFTLVGGTGGAFTGASGIYAKVDNNNRGTGVIGVGNNVNTASVTTTGSGGAFTGQQGVYGKGINATNGTGVIGLGNNGSGYYTYPTYGSGGAFTGLRVGVYGYATRTGSGNNRVGGYFEDNNTYARVGGEWDGTAYGILSNGALIGAKSTNGKSVLMFCTETPEVLYEDFGVGELINGKTHILIDPILSKNINVDESHPLKVFIQLEGDCYGVYVTNKSANGFDVIELQGGSSNVPFSWQIVATRANEEFMQKDGSVEVSDYSKRFPPGPEKLETKEFRSTGVQQKALQQKTVEIKDADVEIKAKEEIEDIEK